MKTFEDEKCRACCSHKHNHHHHDHDHDDDHDHHDHDHDHDHHDHDHDHHHHSANGLSSQLVTIAVTLVLLVAAVLVEQHCGLRTWQLLLVYLVPYLLIGRETLREAWEGICEGDMFNEHFLMSVATVGALLIGFLPGADTQFPEAVAVMLFFQVGELMEGWAEGRSRRSIEHLMDIRPDTATLLLPGGEQTTVSPAQVAVGQTVVVRPGERVPLDGVVVLGTSSLNTVALTGESLPRTVSTGDEVLSGCVNLGGVLHVRVEKVYGESTVARIIDLVEHAGERKSRSETFISRFARIYTPVVVFLARAIALLPPLLLWLLDRQPLLPVFGVWLYRALTFLVVSCPCALVISVPLTFVGGIGGASRQGILIKGSTFIDTLARLHTVVFDKTGTLTSGEFSVSAVHAGGKRRVESGERRVESGERDELLHLAAHVEHYSTHPIAMALRQAYPHTDDDCVVTDVEEVAGQGVKAVVSGRQVCVGNERLMQAVGAVHGECDEAECRDGKQRATVVHVSIDGAYAGHVVISDRVKADAAQAVARLKACGVRRTVMLTGDADPVAAAVAAELRLDEYHAQLLPQDKVEQVEHLLGELPQGRTLAFVGDGINDAPVLARADVGIAMGAMGSDAAVEAADVVVMDDKPSRLALAVALSRRTLAIARQNVVFAIGVKLLVLLLAAMGMATMWIAVFADVGVTVLAVLNALRAYTLPRQALG